MKEHSSTIELWTHGAWGFPEAWYLELGTFAPFCLLAFLIVIPACAIKAQKTNEFEKIQVNPTKSNLFFYRFPPNRVHGVDYQPSRWGPNPKL